MSFTGPADLWSATSAPAANTQATATRTAAGAGVRHVCKRITAVLAGGSAASNGAILNLRDGTTGAGTVLWTAQVSAAANVSTIIDIDNLELIGTAATAMTLEFAAAGGANTLESVTLVGYDL